MVRNLTFAINKHSNAAQIFFMYPIYFLIAFFNACVHVPSHMMQGVVDDINEKIRQRRAAKEDCNFKFVSMEV